MIIGKKNKEKGSNNIEYKEEMELRVTWIPWHRIQINLMLQSVHPSIF